MSLPRWFFSPGDSRWIPRGPSRPLQHDHVSRSRNALACLRSNVSNPSVNQAWIGERMDRASRSASSSARLVVDRSSRILADCPGPRSGPTDTTPPPFCREIRSVIAFDDVDLYLLPRHISASPIGRERQDASSKTRAADRERYRGVRCGSPATRQGRQRPAWFPTLRVIGNGKPAPLLGGLPKTIVG